MRSALVLSYLLITVSLIFESGIVNFLKGQCFPKKQLDKNVDTTYMVFWTLVFAV